MMKMNQAIKLRRKINYSKKLLDLNSQIMRLKTQDT